jgi:hypothetical protein
MLAYAFHPVIFVLAHPVTCCFFQQFIFHTHNPPFTTGGLNTLIQVNIMGAGYHMYNGHIYTYIQLTTLLLFLLWEGQLALDFHVGNK